MQTKSKLSFKYLLCAYMIPIIVSLTMLFVPTKNENTVNVIAVNLKLDDGNYFEKTLSLLRRESDSSVQLIVCPEGIVHLPISSLPINKYFSSLKRLLDSKYINSSIIFGCGLKFNDKFKSQKTEYYNLAIQCNYQGFVSYRNKKILVPFGEYIPYPKYLGRIDRIHNIVKKPISYYEAYDNLFYHNELIILPLICYELNFGNKIRKYYYGQKPNVITCIANEYAVPNSLYNTQFNRLAIIQAINFRKPIIKSSINGYASITNSKGKMIKSEYNSNEIIKEYIEMQTNRTLYAQFGYYPVLVLMVSSIFLTIKIKFDE